VNYLTQVFQENGIDAVDAMNKAYGEIKNIVRRQAYVLAFNDSFLVVGLALLLSAVLVWFCSKTKAGEG
jgi:MFS transporter, DHA2 family, multidrug resistance protein